MTGKGTCAEWLRRIRQLEQEIDARKAAESNFQKRIIALGERAKELDCLLAISALLEKRSNSLDAVLKGTVDLIPPAWKYPEVACARICFNGQEITSF